MMANSAQPLFQRVEFVAQRLRQPVGELAQPEAIEPAVDGRMVLPAEQLERRFEPGLVLYLAGADPHEGDRLGRLKLTFDGLEARDRRVMDWAWTRRLPMAFAMGGGYGHDMEATVQVQMNTYRTALDYAGRWAMRASNANAVSAATHWHNAAA